jgi:hypothetical protein
MHEISENPITMEIINDTKTFFAAIAISRIKYFGKSALPGPVRQIMRYDNTMTAPKSLDLSDGSAP